MIKDEKTRIVEDGRRSCRREKRRRKENARKLDEAEKSWPGGVTEVVPESVGP